MKRIILVIVLGLLFCSCHEWRAKRVIDADKKWYSEKISIIELRSGYRAGDIVESGRCDYILLEEVK